MPGALHEAKLTTRNARAGLPAGLHWRQLDADIHLGYRRATKGGRWVVRWYVGDGNYRRAPLGIADDIIAEGTLSFDQAGKRARELVTDMRAQAAREATAPPETVGSVVTTYIKMRDTRRRALHPSTRQRSDAHSRLTRYVLNDKLADTPLPALTEDMLCAWKARFAPDKNPTSRLRTVSDFKAALNLAHSRLRKRLPTDFAETVRWGLKSDKTLQAGRSKARENQILSDDTVRDIVEAAADFDDDGDVGRMILLLAATGARFSQVRRISVGDVQPERLRIFVPNSRKGQGKLEDHCAVQVSQDVIDALRPALAGRPKDAPLLERWRMVQTSKLEWRRDRRGPWTSSAEITRQWKAICERLELVGIVPYALRHSSIVRAIRSGLPIRLVAAMHDTSVGMIERHYARYIVDGLEELAVRAVIPLVRRRLKIVA
jgi:integrase